MEKIKFRVLVKMENIKTFSDSDSKGVGGFQKHTFHFQIKLQIIFHWKFEECFLEVIWKADPVS